MNNQNNINNINNINNSIITMIKLLNENKANIKLLNYNQGKLEWSIIIEKNNIFKVKELINSDNICSICYNNLSYYNNNFVSCPCCKNIFHKSCKEKWLKISLYKNCVYCRSNIWSIYELEK
jgi:hypothetical protein